MSESSFEPCEIAVVESGTGEDALLVARDPAGCYQGVVCPPDAVESLRTFISPANPALVRLWRAYQQSKGTGPFFWDAIAIAEALRDLRGVPRVRRLLDFTSAGDLFHNSWQARLMREAALAGRNVELLRATPRGKQADFSVDARTAVEVKALINDTTVEVGDNGWRISPPDVSRITRSVRKKCNDALTQVGRDGVVAVALWCDLAGNAIQGLGDAHPISTVAFEPSTFVLALNPSLGPDPFTAIVAPLADVDRVLNSLQERLAEHSQPVQLPFTGRFAGVTNGTGWASVGRSISIANWTEQYAPYETPQPAPLMQTERNDALSQMATALQAAEAQMALWKTLVTQQPIAARPYSTNELNTDPRFTCLFRWGACLLTGLLLLREHPQLLERLLPEGRPRMDARRFMDSAEGPDGRLDAAGVLRLDHASHCMARLTTLLASARTPIPLL